MIKLAGFLAVAAAVAGCLGDDTSEESSALVGSGSGSAALCQITFDTKCKYQTIPPFGPLCLQDPATPRMTIDDPEGHTRPDCGFTHNVQGCNIKADAYKGDTCDLVAGYTTKCK
jgi:hypothetical protein